MSRENEAKQIIVVRNDLRSKLRHGKLAVQVCHASMASYHGDFKIEGVYDFNNQLLGNNMIVPLTEAKHSWITNAFAKIILRVDDLDALLTLQESCIYQNLPHALITDHGRTVFSEPTTTCLGIGPVFPNELTGLTDGLQMY